MLIIIRGPIRSAKKPAGSCDIPDAILKAEITRPVRVLSSANSCAMKGSSGTGRAATIWLQKWAKTKLGLNPEKIELKSSPLILFSNKQLLKLGDNIMKL